jgi:hypothetical protein
MRTHYINIKNDGLLHIKSPDGMYNQQTEFCAKLVDVGIKNSAYGTEQYFLNFMKHDSDDDVYCLIGEKYNSAILALFNFLDSVERYRDITIKTYMKVDVDEGKTRTYLVVFNGEDRLAWKDPLANIPRIDKNGKKVDDTNFQKSFYEQLRSIKEKLRRKATRSTVLF